MTNDERDEQLLTAVRDAVRVAIDDALRPFDGGTAYGDGIIVAQAVSDAMAPWLAVELTATPAARRGRVQDTMLALLTRSIENALTQRWHLIAPPPGTP